MITVKLLTSEDTKTVSFDLDDLGVSQETWDGMTDQERRDAIDEAVNDLHEQPYWTMDTYKIDD